MDGTSMGLEKYCTNQIRSFPKFLFHILEFPDLIDFHLKELQWLHSIESTYGIYPSIPKLTWNLKIPLSKGDTPTNTTIFWGFRDSFRGVYIERHVYRNILLEFQDSKLHNL